jgi:hypothetical protein
MLLSRVKQSSFESHLTAGTGLRRWHGWADSRCAAGTNGGLSGSASGSGRSVRLKRIPLAREMDQVDSSRAPGATRLSTVRTSAWDIRNARLGWCVAATTDSVSGKKRLDLNYRYLKDIFGFLGEIHLQCQGWDGGHCLFHSAWGCWEVDLNSINQPRGAQHLLPGIWLKDLGRLRVESSFDESRGR